LEKWVTQPDLKQAQVSLVLISEDILKGDQNSIVPEGKQQEKRTKYPCLPRQKQNIRDFFECLFKIV